MKTPKSLEKILAEINDKIHLRAIYKQKSNRIKVLKPIFEE